MSATRIETSNLYAAYLSGAKELPDQGDCTLDIRPGSIRSIRVTQGKKSWLCTSSQVPNEKYEGPGKVLAVTGPTNPGIPNKLLRIFVVEVSIGEEEPEVKMVGESILQKDKDRDDRADPNKSSRGKEAYRRNRSAHQRGVDSFVRSAKGKQFYRDLAKFNQENGDKELDLHQMVKKITEPGEGEDPRQFVKLLRRAARGKP